MKRWLGLFLVAAAAATYVGSGVSRIISAQAPPPPKQAVVETTAGTFIIDLSPETAPNQAAYFMKVAAAGGYDATIFHRMIPRGMVQAAIRCRKIPRSARPMEAAGSAR